MRLRALGLWIVLGLLPLLSHGGHAQTPPTTTLSFPSSADTYVDAGSATSNFNSKPNLLVDASPVRVAYLRFTVTGVNGRVVQAAKLQLGATSSTASGATGGTVHVVTNTTWNEATLTYNTRPAVGTALATAGTVASGQTVTFDLGAATVPGDGVYSFAVDSTNSAGVAYNSALATSGLKPTLVLTLAATPPTVTISAPPQGGSFFVGDAVTLQGSAHDASNVDLSNAIHWSSNLAGALGTGSVVTTSALGQGSHTLTASVVDANNVTGSATVGITVDTRPPHVNTAPLLTITSPTATQTLASGLAVTFAANASDLEDGNLAGSVVWTSELDGALGTGTFTKTLSEGTHTITATVTDSGGLQATANVIVAVQAGVALDFPAIADASVDSSQADTKLGLNPTLAADANAVRNTFLRFTVTGVGTRQIIGAVLRMQVDATPGAESDSGGLLRTISDGTWDEATVTYNTRPALTGGFVVASAGPVHLGDTVDFDVLSAVTGDGTYNFALTNNSADEVDYRSREGGPAPTLIVTLAGNAPKVTITSPATGSVFFQNDTVTLTGTATDVEDGNLANQLQWTSSRDGALGTGAAISTSSLSVGTHLLTASVTDSDGLMGKATVSVRVRGPNTPPQVAITGPAEGAMIPNGTPVTLAATVTDDFDTNLGASLQWSSSRDGILGTGASLTRVLSAGAHTITATVTDSDHATGSAVVHLTITRTNPTVTITAPAGNATVFAGTAVSFAATASDLTDGTISSSLRWTSDLDGQIGVGPGFTTSTLRAGTHTITAIARNSANLTGTAQRTVVVRPPNAAPVVAVVVPGNNTSLLTGKPALLGATATDAEDGDLGASIRWTSSRDGNLGTGALITVPSLSVGGHVLTASVTDHDGATSTASVAVNVLPTTVTFAATADTYVDAGKPTSVFGTATSLSAISSPAKIGFLRFVVAGLNNLKVQSAALKLTATVKSSSGGVLKTLTNNTWTEAATTYNTRPTIDGPTVATQGSVAANQVVSLDVTSAVTGDGTVNFGLTSTASAVCTYASREASSGQPQLVLTLTQDQAPLVRILAPASGSRVIPGSPVTLTGAAVDAESGDVSSLIQWTSSLDGPLGTGASVVTSSLRSGLHTITAKVTDAGGAVGQASIQLSVLNRPVVRINSPADGAVFFQSQLPTTLAGSAIDVEDGDVSSRIQWRSDKDGALASGASIQVNTLSIGTHVITATAIDDDGLTGTASITLKVRGPNQAPVVTITAPADGASVGAGTALGMTATVTDDFDTNLPGQLRWFSSKDGALGTGASLTKTLSEGAHTLTATVTDSNGAPGSASVHVTITPTPPVVTITAPAAGTRVFRGTAVGFSATAIDATDGNVGATLVWTSDRDGQIGLGTGFTTSTLSTGTHTITASAKDGGNLVGKATVTVVIRPPNVAPTVTITQPMTGSSMVAGPVLIAASALDTEDGDLSQSVRWTSSRDGALGTGAALVVPSLSQGTHTLTAAVTDVDGATSTATATVTIVPPTITLSPVADTYVDGGAATSKFGTATSLTVMGSPVRQAFLRFNVTGVGNVGVKSATLRLTATSAKTANSTAGGEVHSITDNTWSESTTTFNNKPAVDGPVLATQGAVALKQVVNFDVTTGVRGDGVQNFAIVSTVNDDVIYNSREASSGAPQLILALGKNQGPVVNITAPANGLKTKPGVPVTFTGRALDAENGDLSAQIQWRSDRDGALGTGASLVVSTLSPGLHTITAHVADAAGVPADASITVNVAHPPVVTISGPADGSVFYVAQLPITFSAQANDVEDGDLSSGIQWSSDLEGPLASGATITAGGLAVGTHTITAKVTDSTGLTGQSQIVIRVRNPNAAPQLTILSPLDGSSVPAGQTSTLTASALDDFDGDISNFVQWSSSKDGALFQGASRTIILSEGQHVLTATVTDSDGAPASAQVHVTVTPTPPVVKITAPASGVRVFGGTNLTFTGTSNDATDGNLTTNLRWTSDLDGPIGTGATFSTNHLSVGTHNITASSTDLGGLVGRAQITVVIRPPNVPPVVTIQTPGDGASLLSGKPVVLAATAMDAEDGDLSSTITWKSSKDGNLGTGTTILRPSLSAGTHVITASATDQDGATTVATATINIVPSTLTFTAVADTYVDSAKATTAFGTATSMQAATTRQSFLRFLVTGVGGLKVQQAQVRLTVATASTVGGTLRSITNTSWTEAGTTWATRPAVDGAVLSTLAKVAAKAVVNFDATSAVTKDGEYDFALVSTSSTAVGYNSREASTGKPQLVLTLTQNTAPVVNITGPANGTVVNIGAPVTLAGTAVDAESGNLSANIQWSSSLDGNLGTGASLVVSALRPGTHVITAKVTDVGGLTGQAQVTLQVGHKPVVSIASPHDRSVFFLSQLPVSFVGTASDFEDGNLTGRIQWSSDKDGALGSGPSLTRSLTLGRHVITASVTDANGLVGQAQVGVRVRGPNVAPVLTITAPQDNSSTPAGTAVTLSATAIDDFDGDISSQVVWTSTHDGALFTGASKSIVLKEGSHVITASVTDSDGVTSTQQINFTVTPTPPVVTIATPAAGTTVIQAANTSFNATAIDATDGDLSSSIQWTSDRDGTIGVGGSFATSSLSEGTHTITATATDSGNLVAAAHITLTVIRVPTVTILLPQQNDGYLTGKDVTFYATATDKVDGDVSSTLVWTSDRDGQIGTGPSFTTQALSVGTHNITATAKNALANSGTAQVTITVAVGTLTFDPIMDTYGDESFPTTNFGTSLELDVGSNAPTRKMSFLRFAVGGIGQFPVIGTHLQLTVGTSSTADGGIGGIVNAISDNTWTEASVTWKKGMPAIDGPIVGSVTLPVAPGQHVDFDLGTAVTTNGTYNFAVTSPNTNAAKYESRESLTVANRPHLVVLLGQPATRRPPTVAITAPATGTSIFDNQTATLTATATDQRDGDLTSAITWRSSIDGALGTGGSITPATLHRGTHTITASVKNSLGIVSISTIQLKVVNRPPVVTITAPPDGRLFPVGFAANFTATAQDSIDGDIGASIAWTSDKDGQIGTGRSITKSNLSAGDHTITASATNSLGTRGSTSISISVGNGAPKINLTSPADGTTVAEGTTVTLAATANDPEDGDLTSRIAWSSDLQGALGTGGNVPVVLTATGTQHITASVTDSGNQVRSKTVTVTVNPAPPVLTILAPADGFSTSGAVTFSATAIDFKDGDKSSAIKWSSSVTGVLGTGPSVTANRLPFGRHVITASVTDSDGLTATKTITIGVGNTPPKVTITAPANGTSVSAGTSLNFTGSATDGLDGNVTANIKWFSNLNGLIGTGGSFSTSTLARGTHVVTAQVADSGGLTGTAFVVVTITAGGTVGNNNPPQVTISSPANNTAIGFGGSVTFAATAIDEAGDISSNLTWVSSIDGVIGTGRSFTTTVLSAGQHRVTASVSDQGGLVGSASVVVTVSSSGLSFPVVADAYTDAGTTVNAGTGLANMDTNFGGATVLRLFNQPVERIYLRFNVTGVSGPIARAVVRLTTSSAANSGSDSGGEIHTVSAPWDELTITHNNKPALDAAIVSSVAGPIVPSQTVDYDVTSVVTGNGTYNFGLKTLSTDRAEFISREGGAGAPALLIFKNIPANTNPTVHITSPVDASILGLGVPTTFTATATDPTDGNITSSLTWKSDRDGVLGTGASITKTLSQGPHVITATATNSKSVSAADLIHVTVGSGAPTVLIASPANTSTTVYGTPTIFIGTGFSSRDGDVSFQLQWSSDLDGPLGTGPSFSRILSPGTHTITASVSDSGGKTGTASITYQVSATRVGYEDFSYGTIIDGGGGTGNLDKATATKPQSKIWYVDDVWWAWLFNTTKSEYHIYRLDVPSQTWIDTGVVGDDRGKSRADCLWDAASGHLYVASRYGFSVTPPQNRIYRYTYFSGAQQWALDPGFPANIPLGGTEGLTIAKDGTGMLWITGVVSGQVLVSHTIGNDDTNWSNPYFLPAPEGNPAETTSNGDMSAVEYLPGTPGRIGVLWSNQLTQKWYFMSHVDGTPAEQASSWQFEIAAAGASIADNHLNMKVASDGRLFAAVKTSRTTSGQTLVGLLVRSTSGVWSPLIKVTNVDFDPTRPNVVLDEVNRKVYVAYADFFSDAYYKAADMDNPVFTDTGIGTPLMVSGTHPVDPHLGGPGGINNVTTTKQVLDPSVGTLFIAANGDTAKYWHGWVILPKPTPIVTITAPASNLKFKAGTAIGFAANAESGTDGVVTPAIKWTSSRDGQFGTGGTVNTSSLSTGVHTITASATDSSKLTGTAQITVAIEQDAPPVVTVTAPTTGQKFKPGQAVTFTGSALDSLDGDRTSTMTWTSSLDGQIGTGGSFTKSNLSLGHHIVTVRATDTANLVGTATFAIDVNQVGPPVLTLTAPADGKKFAFGSNVAFGASAIDPFDGDISSKIAWTSDRDGAVGTGGSFFRGTLTRGAHTLTASIVDTAGLSATATTHVTILDDAPPVVAISSPTATLFATGKAITFTATAIDTIDGDRTSTLTWSSNRDGAIGTGGSFTRSNLSVGVHTITASATDANGLVGTATLTLEVRDQPAPAVTITAPADNSEVLFGQSAGFTATATDTIDGSIASSITWSSDRQGVIGTGASISTTSLALGAHVITASAKNSGNLTGTAQIHMNVASGPQLVILGPADGTVYAQGDSVTLSGLAFDFEDGDITSRITWTSSRDGSLGTGGTVTTTSLSRGVHTITMSATDNDHHTATVTMSVEVVAPPTILIGTPADNTLFKRGDVVSFIGFASDPVDGNLTPSLVWTSSIDGPIGTGGNFTTTTLHSGTHTITATATNARHFTGRKTITIVVNDPPVLTITAPAAGARFVQGTPVALTATATDTEDGTLTSAIKWSSSRDGSLGTGGSLNVTTLSAGVHTITATVTDSGNRTVSDARSITVNGRPVVTIAAPADGTKFNQDDTVTLSATASDPEDGDVSTTLAWVSDKDGSLGSGASLTRTLSPGTHVLTATATDHDGNTGTKSVTVTVNARPTITITAPATGADFGHAASVTFSATATDPEDGSLSNAITWSSSRDGNLGSGPSVTTSTLSSGTHTITATVVDSGHITVTASITITVNGAPVVTITAPAAGSSFLPSAAITFSATATDFEDGDLTSTIAWTEGATSLGTGGSITLTSLTAGNHTITASVMDASHKPGSMQVTIVVNTPPVVTITAPANGTSFEPAATATFTATATDAEDGDLAGSIMWTSSRDGSIGSGPSLSTTTLSTGTHTITASVSDHLGKTSTTSITVVVNATPVVTITAPASTLSPEPLTAVTFSATATDAEDGNVASAIKWTEGANVLGTGGSISVSTLTAGSHTITASVTDSGNKTGSASVTIVVNTTPTVSITAPAAGSTYEPGAGITFTGTGNDAEDGTLAIAWSSDLDGALGTGASLTVSTLHAGTHTITAKVTDAGGKTASATTTVVVNATPTVTITAPATGSTYEHGDVVTFAATASDPEDGNLTSQIKWTSDRDGDLGTGFTVSTISLSSGTHVITASATDTGHKTGHASITITVNSTPTVTIAPLADSTFEPGAAIHLSATAGDLEDHDLTAGLVWKADGTPFGAGATATISTLPSGAHTITASVTDSGNKTGSASVQVTVNATPQVTITAPTTLDYEPNTAITFTATATDAEDGDLAAHLVWTDGATTVGSGASIQLSTLSSGTHTLTASATDSGNRTGHASVTVTINAAPAVVISSPADHATFEPGATVTFTAAASDVEDGSLSTAIVWTADGGTALGTGASVATSTLASGNHAITATVTDQGGKSAHQTITVNVNATPVVTIATPADGSVYEPGAAIGFAATATDTEDGTLANVQWTEGATVLGTGTSFSIATLASGSHTITASATDGGSKTGHASITVVVNATPTVHVDTPASGTIAQPGAAVVFTASANDPEDGALTNVVWTDGATPIGSGTTISVNDLSTGLHTITASATDSGHKTGHDSVTVRIDATPVLAIMAPATGSEFEPGTPVGFAATATDAEDGDLSAHVTWTSSIDGDLGTGASISHTLTSGTHTIVASVTDQAGQPASKAIVVVVNAAPAVTITAPATGTVFDPGAAIGFTATATDPEDGTLANVTWSEGATVLGTGTSFSTSALAAGTHTITASATDAGNKTGQATVVVVVDAAPGVVITAPADGDVFDPGAEVTFTATATDAEQGDLSSTIVWTEGATTLGTGPTLATSSLASGSHTITATVTDGASRTGHASITVRIDARPTVSISTPHTGDVFAEGDAIAFTASANDPEEGDVTSTIVWTANPGGTLGSGATVSVADLGPGSYTITASATDGANRTGTAAIIVTIDAKPVVTITAPATTSFVDGTAIAFAATATDAEDGDRTAIIVWSEGATTLATGAGFSTSALGVGSHTVTATVADTQGKSASASVSITVSDAVPSLTIQTPADGTVVPEGTDVAFAATAADIEDGDLTAAIAWSVDGGAYVPGATLDAGILAPGAHSATAAVVDAGSHTVTATVGITVDAAPSIAITDPADGSSFVENTAVGFTASASDPEQGDLGAAIAWSVDGVDTGVTGTSLAAASLAVGGHTITATVTDAAGNVRSASIGVTIVADAAPLLSIDSPANNAVVAPGLVTFTASASDDLGGPSFADGIAWTVDGNAAGTGASIQATLAAGAHTIEASVTDSASHTVTQTVTLTADGGPSLAITDPADGASFAAGTDVQFTASSTDDLDGDLSANVAWSLDGVDTGVTGATFTPATLPSGTHTIGASVSDSAGHVATTSISITIEE